MRRLRTLIRGILLAVALQRAICFAAVPAKAPDLREVVSILETNRPAGMTQSEFNSTAVQGLLSGLGQAYLVPQGGQSGSEAPPITKAEVFDKSIAYLRIGRVVDGLPQAAQEVLKGYAISNKISGVVLDLRYATGQSYAAAADLVSLFLSKARPLMDWGAGMKNSGASSNAFNVPVAVLINEETSSAAEAAAAAFRDAGAGLLFGSQTAGRAAIPKDFTLSNGQVLRIGTEPIKLGSGALLSGKVKPDIQIQLSAQEGRAYYADAFAVISQTNQVEGTNGLAGTNRVSRRTRFNEAELVREHNSRSRGEGPVSPEKQAETPVVSDPVLARAIDVLKGLALVRHGRS